MDYHLKHPARSTHGQNHPPSLPLKATKPSKRRNKTRNLRIPLVACILFLVAASLACNLTAGEPEAQSPADPENLEAALAAAVVDDRPAVLEYLGRPDAFDISAVEVEGVVVRLESWRYYQFGTRVDFVDGEAVWTAEIEPMADGTLLAAWYDPLAFEIGMTGAQAVRVVAAASPAGAKPTAIDLAEGGEDLAGGSALVGDQILIGLYQDQVVYVETMALAPEGGAQ